MTSSAPKTYPLAVAASLASVLVKALALIVLVIASVVPRRVLDPVN